MPLVLPRGMIDDMIAHAREDSPTAFVRNLDVNLDTLDELSGQTLKQHARALVRYDRAAERCRASG